MALNGLLCADVPLRTYCYFKAQVLQFPGHQISSVSEWVIDLSTQFVSMGYLNNGGGEWKEIWHKGNVGDEDDAQTLNTRIAQRKRTIPRSTMKNTRNIIECCHNTHQGAPRTSKQKCACTSDLSDASHVTCLQYMTTCDTEVWRLCSVLLACWQKCSCFQRWALVCSK